VSDDVREALLSIIGYSAEVASPNELPVIEYYTDRHLSPILDALVEYVEGARADERAAIHKALDAEKPRWEAEIRADEQAKTLEWCCKDTEPDIRERIAQQIEGRMADDPHFQPWADAMEEAARIARGGESDG